MINAVGRCRPLLNGESRSNPLMRRTILASGQKFPMVNAALFNTPMATTCCWPPISFRMPSETEFKIVVAGGGAMFGAAEIISLKCTKPQSAMDLDGESFADKIEGYGVRSVPVATPSAPNGGGRATAPVDVAVSMQAVTNELAPCRGCRRDRPPGAAGKNHIPNPCFRRQFNESARTFSCPIGGRAMICPRSRFFVVAG